MPSVAAPRPIGGSLLAGAEAVPFAFEPIFDRVNDDFLHLRVVVHGLLSHGLQPFGYHFTCVFLLRRLLLGIAAGRLALNRKTRWT